MTLIRICYSFSLPSFFPFSSPPYLLSSPFLYFPRIFIPIPSFSVSFLFLSFPLPFSFPLTLSHFFFFLFSTLTSLLSFFLFLSLLYFSLTLSAPPCKSRSFPSLLPFTNPPVCTSSTLRFGSYFFFFLIFFLFLF